MAGRNPFKRARLEEADDEAEEDEAEEEPETICANDVIEIALGMCTCFCHVLWSSMELNPATFVLRPPRQRTRRVTYSRRKACRPSRRRCPSVRATRTSSSMMSASPASARTRRGSECG